MQDTSDNIYYNVIISNPMVVDPTNPYGNNNVIPAVYEENRTQAIITDPSKYEMTIVRFELPGANIPICILPRAINILNPLDLNFTPLQFIMTYLGDPFVANLVYVPGFAGLNPPPPPPQPVPSQNPYYWIFSYQHMINMMNTTMTTAFNALKTIYPALPQTEAPYFIYNPETQLISMIVQKNYVGSGILIGMNSDMLRFLRGFYYDFGFITQPGNPSISYVSFNISDTKNNSYDATHYEIKQEFVTLQYWNSFKNIVFITGTIPIQAEYIPELNGQGSNNFRPILTDFEPILSEAGDARSTLQYYPQGPYRMVSLLSNTPLTKFDVRVFWQDQENNLYPIVLSPGMSLSIKFLFSRRYNTS